MSKAYFRQEISYDHWTALEPREPAQTTQLGGVEQDNRRLVDTVFWNCAYRLVSALIPALIARPSYARPMNPTKPGAPISKVSSEPRTIVGATP